MITHYFTIALRNMRRFKLQTIVCLTGLAVGMTCFALGTLWLRFIESFEDFVPDGDNIYLVMEGNGKSLFHTGNYYFTSVEQNEEMQEHVPGVIESTFLVWHDNTHNLKAGEVELEFKPAFADTPYLRMFGIEAVEGTLQDFRDGDVIFTRSLARRVFGTEQAVGREVMLEAKLGQDMMPFRVVAVIDDRPHNSQMRYDALLCCDAVSHPKRHSDGNSTYVYFTNAFCFVKFAPAVPRDSIVGTHSMAYVNENGCDTVQFTFAPLTSLRTDFITSDVKIGTSYVRWFMSLGLLVILCSLANYLITMVSHLRRRGWEFSLRRVLGSSRAHILYMVALESLLTFLLATALATVLTWLVLPAFREYSDIDIAWNAMAQRLATYLLLVIACGMALTVITAWLVMYRVAPLPAPPRGRAVSVLTRSAIITSPRGSGEGGCGVLLQLALSMAIIFCAVVMLMQVRMLMYSDELGFCHTDRAVVYQPNDTLKQKLSQSPLVVESLEDATVIFPRSSLSYESLKTEETHYGDKDFYKHNMYQCCIDSTVFRFYSMSLVTGELPTFGRGEVALNEAACALLDLTPENAVGTKVYRRTLEFTVSGVIRDAYQLGALVKPDPMAYHPTDKWPTDGSFVGRGSHIALRTQPGRVKELCDSINAWKEQMNLPEPEFIGMQVENCEEEFEEYIRSEQMLIKILFTVGGASLFVCVIGTFSLVSLSLQRRRKEIAIRKVHGARLPDILRLFLKGQVISLGIAALVAYPVAYIIMRHWLENYQKQITISLWLIPATFAAIAAVVLGTITLKIWWTAKESTVEALK